MDMRDARTIGPKALEERRHQAVALFRKGMKRIEIAEVVGVHRNTVGQWIRAWRRGGSKALRAKAPGRPVGSGRRLMGYEAAAIKRIITDNTPDQLKFPFALWTRDAVRLLIKEKYAINMPVRTMGEYLKRWGFTPQKPVRRAYERSEPAVRRWLEEQYPAIRKAAKEQGAEIHWGDETGLRSDDVTGRGFSPAGKTPVRRVKGTPEKINMVSTITNRGKVRFMFYRGSMCAKTLNDFLRRLVKDVDHKIFLILDNLAVHHCGKVKEWVEAHKDRIAVFYLPSYSPDLNPDEYLNSDLKSNLSRQPETRRKGALEKSARSHMRRLQRRPGHVRNYFNAKSIRYAAEPIENAS